MPALCRALHLLELAHLLALHTAAGEAGVGGEEPERLIAPVVGQPAFDKLPIGERLVHGEQFDGRDAERFEIVERGRRREPRIGPAQVWRNLRVAGREALDVDLVDL